MSIKKNNILLNCEVIMDYHNISIEEGNNECRKRISKQSKREERKKQKYSDKDPALENFKRPCNHDGKSYACCNITLEDIKLLRKEFYSDADKFRQDIQLCQYISVVPAKRRRSMKEIKQRNATLCYLLYTANGQPVRVCNAFFTSVFEISKHRILTVAKGTDSKERRGGDRRSQKSAIKKEKARIFISNLQEKESLSVKEFHKLYVKQCEAEDHVSYGMFRNIFLSD
ncbi:unnamed protein product [Brassicogethes aeneus]|uniref:Uncharacterized protein n=1 Tax=Brassicogethes aeneus TaxID=1431903 RepID=A0A9P0B0T7_BRAAE|nr:unnamed protein product [Brassicogethes aeneus]